MCLRQPALIAVPSLSCSWCNTSHHCFITIHFTARQPTCAVLLDTFSSFHSCSAHLGPAAQRSTPVPAGPASPPTPLSTIHLAASTAEPPTPTPSSLSAPGTRSWPRRSRPAQAPHPTAVVHHCSFPTRRRLCLPRPHPAGSPRPLLEPFLSPLPVLSLFPSPSAMAVWLAPMGP